MRIFSLSLAFLFSQWQCCGVTGHTDWHDALQEKTVPDRCCQEHFRECGRNATNIFWSQVSLWYDINLPQIKWSVLVNHCLFIFTICDLFLTVRVATRRLRNGSTTTNICWEPSQCVCWSYRYFQTLTNTPTPKSFLAIVLPGMTSCPVWHKADVISSFLQLLGMAFSMTLYQQIHRAGKKYDA